MKLRVRARDSAMVPDIDAMEAHVRRFIGRRLDSSLGIVYKDAENVERRQAVFVPIDDAVEVPSYPEYVRSVKEGDLWAADEATANYCGVKFDSNFGVVPEKASK